MIENILAFSSYLHLNRNNRCGAVAVGELLEHAANALMGEIENAGCRFEMTVAPGLPPVAGDPAAVELVLRNLIGNAVRHGKDGKWIGVSAIPFDRGVQVCVCDHGPGIPEAERDCIFEPFYRGEETRARVPGTGLGLSLVKSTVERCQGTVNVRESSGGGAQFVLQFPPVSEHV